MALSSDQLKRKLRAYAQRHGVHSTKIKLIVAGLSPAMCYELLRGNYVSELKATSIKAIQSVVGA